MDICIPYCKSSWGDNELRFALRSIQKHLSGFNQVYLIGYKPGWVKNVVHIEAYDGVNCKQYNILKKLLKCPSDKFLLWNDDHYLLKPINANLIPFYAQGTIRDAINKRTGGKYKGCMLNTDQLLKSLNKTTYYFDVHTPMIFDGRLKELLQFNWQQANTFIIKSLYANLFDIQPTPTTDYKIGTPKTEQELNELNATWISSGETIFPGLRKFLFDSFAEKSEFEM